MHVLPSCSVCKEAGPNYFTQPNFIPGRDPYSSMTDHGMIASKKRWLLQLLKMWDRIYTWVKGTTLNRIRLSTRMLKLGWRIKKNIVFRAAFKSAHLEHPLPSA